MARRFCQIVGVKPDQVAQYEHLHEAVWPGVLKTIEDCHIHNYSIFRYGELLIAYFEYTGDDYEADMARMAADPLTREWWTRTDPLQVPLEGRAEGEWWLRLKEVFHTD